MTESEKQCQRADRGKGSETGGKTARQNSTKTKKKGKSVHVIRIFDALAEDVDGSVVVEDRQSSSP